MTLAYAAVEEGVRIAECYHCTSNTADHKPVVTEQWAKYVGSITQDIEPLLSWECRRCKKLIPDIDFNLKAA